MLNWIPGLSPFVARFRLSVKKNKKNKKNSTTCLSQRRIGAAERKMRSDSYSKFGVNRAHFMRDFPGFSRGDTQPRQQPQSTAAVQAVKEEEQVAFSDSGERKASFPVYCPINVLAAMTRQKKKANSVGNGFFLFFFNVNGIGTVDWDMIRVLTVFKSARACAKPSKAKHEQPDKTADWTWLPEKRKRIKSQSERQELKTRKGGESHCRHKQRTDVQSASANSQLR